MEILNSKIHVKIKNTIQNVYILQIVTCKQYSVSLEVLPYIQKK